MRQQFARKIDGALAPDAGAQEYRQQFGIGERLCALCYQTLTRAFGCGPVGNCHNKIEFLFEF